MNNQGLEKTVCELVMHLLRHRSDLVFLPLGIPGEYTFRSETDLLEFRRWALNYFSGAVPENLKRFFLKKHGIPGAVWVETGTHKGETAAVLASVASRVYTIEPYEPLYKESSEYLRSYPNVEVLHGTSESLLGEVLRKIEGPVNFWLDGHNSGEETFKGPNDTPILHELKMIEERLYAFTKAKIFIDDLRLFTGKIYSYGPYPTKGNLVEWAERNDLGWEIWQDIFIIEKK